MPHFWGWIGPAQRGYPNGRLGQRVSYEVALVEVLLVLHQSRSKKTHFGEGVSTA